MQYCSSLLYCCPLKHLHRGRSTLSCEIDCQTRSSNFYCTERRRIACHKLCDLCVQFLNSSSLCGFCFIFRTPECLYLRLDPHHPPTHPPTRCRPTPHNRFYGFCRLHYPRAKAKVMTPSFSVELSLDSTLLVISSTPHDRRVLGSDPINQLPVGAGSIGDERERIHSDR